VLQLAGRPRGIGQVAGRQDREVAAVALGECRERLVQQPVPRDALLDPERVRMHVGPRREDLAIDAGGRHAREAPGRLLDQLREERAQAQTIREVQRVAGGLGLDHGHAVARAVLLEPLHERPRHVVGVDVDHRADRASASQRARFFAESGSSRTTTPLAARARRRRWRRPRRWPRFRPHRRPWRRADSTWTAQSRG